MTRLSVLKTYKVYINGQFVRSESGRYFEFINKQHKKSANVCLCSRKDVKNAVTAARHAFPSWSNRSAFNRSQILYRMAEMVEGKKQQMIEELVLQGYKKTAAQKELEESIDLIIYYAGWCDKYSQLFSSVNPVASSHFNFSVPEALGVISILAPNDSGVLGLISSFLPVIAGGNTCVILASEKIPLSAITLTEALACSDIPAGVINVLTGKSEELHTVLASHMDVNALVYCRHDKKEIKACKELCSTNVKQFFMWNTSRFKTDLYSPYLLLEAQAIKTTWHPIDINSGAGSIY